MASEKMKAAAHKLAAKFDPHDAHVGIAENAVDGSPDKLVVHVTRSKSIMRRFTHQLPKEIDGIPVEVDYVGQIRPARLGQPNDGCSDIQ